MSLTRINAVGIPLTVVMLLSVLLPFAALHGLAALSVGFDTFFRDVLIVLAGLVVSVVAHELLHALGWMVFGRVPFRQIQFGVKSLTPYAHATVTMPARGYRIGAALPGLVLGLLPGIAAWGTGSGPLAFYGAFMFSVAVGDAIILWMLRDVPGEVLVQDHPSEAGAQILWDSTPI